MPGEDASIAGQHPDSDIGDDRQDERPSFDSSVAHIARVYNYWLGRVGVMLVAILHLIADEDDPYGLVATLMDAVPPGSYLTVSHLASDIAATARAEATERLRLLMHEKQTPRSRSEVARFFEGLEMIEPGLVRIPEWRPDSGADAKSPSALWGGMGHKR